MNTEQQEALLTIALFAAFADGIKSDAERGEIRRIAKALTGEAGTPDLTRLVQDVLLQRISLAAATACLTDAGHRQACHCCPPQHQRRAWPRRPLWSLRRPHRSS